jgi:hypothetical protein
MVERVLTHNFKVHFLDHLKDDFKRLAEHIKHNFQEFPLVKKIMTLFAFLGSLGFVGKFMGGMLAMKVFVAKFWSFILAIVLKFSTAIVYFFTDYLWGSWIAPFVEIVIFTWLLEWMERIPFLKKYIAKMYSFFLSLFEWFEDILEKIFHIPVKRFFKFLAKRIKKRIYQFIGYTKVSAWKRLQEVRMLTPNSHMLLLEKRKVHKVQEKKNYISAREHLVQRRKARK